LASARVTGLGNLEQDRGAPKAGDILTVHGRIGVRSTSGGTVVCRPQRCDGGTSRGHPVQEMGCRCNNIHPAECLHIYRQAWRWILKSTVNKEKRNLANESHCNGEWRADSRLSDLGVGKHIKPEAIDAICIKALSIFTIN
jgi:hypothetical protein